MNIGKRKSTEQLELDLEWDLKDRDRRVASGELTEPIADPTEVIVSEDD